MALTALILANLALLLALLARLKAASAADAAESASTDARRYASNAEQTLTYEVKRLRSLAARLADGEDLDGQMVRDDILWKDVDLNEAKELIAQGKVALLDVRTPQETSMGIIPGAQLLPMDDIDDRKHELPTDKPLLVYCAGGGRSASVCEHLSDGPYQLMNLTGGFGSWDGPVERPS